MIYSEAAYFDGNHCQHCAERDDQTRLKRKMPKALPRVRRPFDVSDSEAFPNIAEAIRRAREKGK